MLRRHPKYLDVNTEKIVIDNRGTTSAQDRTKPSPVDGEPEVSAADPAVPPRPKAR
jgi:hypothetical protein